MVYLILALLIVLTALLLLRVRVRFEISQHRRLLFMGLGRSGPEFDFANKVTRVKLLGFTVKSIPRVAKAKPAPQPELQRERARRVEELEKEYREEQEKLQAADKGRPSPPSSRTELIGLLRDNSQALLEYGKRLWKSLVIEELNGQIQGGFESPHLTGQALGCYYAVMGAAPSLAGHFSYVPVWTGRSLSGNLRLQVALPLYTIVYRTIVLLIQLPVRRIIQFIKRQKKGVHNGAEQRYGDSASGRGRVERHGPVGNRDR